MDPKVLRAIVFSFLSVLILLIVVFFIDNHHFYSFVDGFWKVDHGTNDMIVYFDTEQSKAHVIISREGITLSDRHYAVDISHIGQFINISDVLFRPDFMKYNVSFSLLEDDELDEENPYDALFIDIPYSMQVSISKGMCELHSDTLEMTLFKDNVTNYKFMEFLLY